MGAIENHTHLSESLRPLEQYKQFILYKLVPSKSRPGKKDKIPVDPANMHYTDAHDPTIWDSYDAIKIYANALGEEYGVGFVFTDQDPFYFLDVDNCYQKDDWSELAKYLIACLPGAAVEVSQSGTGLHIIGTTQPQEHSCRNGQYGIELYTKDRFVALTDKNTIGNCLTDCTTSLKLVIDYYFSPAMPKQIIEWRNESVPESNPIMSDSITPLSLLKLKVRAPSGSLISSFCPIPIRFVLLNLHYYKHE